jgi:hypothetical protein
MKKISVFFIMFMLFAVMTLADFSYNETGNFDGDYINGFGIFNTQLTDYPSPETRTLSNPFNTPLVSDMDGDGVNEIIVLDNSQIRLFHESDLEIIDAFSIPTTYGRFSNHLVYDIDGDGRNEYIVSGEEVDGEIYIIEYNGTALYLQKNFTDVANTEYADGEILIKCGEVNKCLAVYSSCFSNVGGGGYCTGGRAGNLYGRAFNSTDLGTTALIATDGATSDSTFCFPKVRNMEYANFDSQSSSDSEFIFSAINHHSDSPDTDYLYIEYIDVNSSLGINPQMEISESLGNLLVQTSGTASCDNVLFSGDTLDDNKGAGVAITNALVYNADGINSNGLETIAGFMVDNNEYKIYAYLSNGNILDDFPEVEDADGRMISNVIRANSFPESGTNSDFCVMGYQEENQLIDLTCGSLLSTFGLLNFETIEYSLSIDGLYNITQDYGVLNSIIHATRQSTATTEGNNMDEIANSYGILSLSTSGIGCFNTADCALINIFENPEPDAVVISVDAEKVGRDDLIAMQQTNLWYIDDGYSNSPAIIAEYSINPCLDSVWQLNTSVDVLIKVTDADLDNVAAKAILYLGDDNEQNSGYSINLTTGTIFPFSFVANKTINNGVLEIYGRDTFQPTEEYIIPFSFTVANTGVENGDCITEVTLDANSDGILDSEAEDGNATPLSELLELNEDDNAITNALSSLDSFGLNLGLKALWVLIMVVVGFVILTTKTINNDTVKFWGMIVIETGLLILGGLLGYFGFIIIFTYLVVLVAAVIFYIKSKVTGTVTQN